MLTKRVIACLDVRDGRVVKGVQFKNHVDMGDIVDLATFYSVQGVDDFVLQAVYAQSKTQKLF